MESVIARLLKDFEGGKLTRRQLIQSLAMAAVAAPAAAAATPRLPHASLTGEAAPWKTVFLDHISYQVADHKRSSAFYSELMGWTINNSNDNQTSLTIGDGIGGIIIRNRRPPAEGAAAPAPAPQGDRPPITGVINHISWGIEPWDKEGVKAELEKRGLTPRVDDQGDNFQSWHVRDPDGWDLQISNQTS